jgi:peptide deformylase
VIRTLIPDSDPVLHTPAQLIGLDHEDNMLIPGDVVLWELERDMFETMEACNKAVGLAAVQIGVPIAAIAIKTERKKMFCLNPRVLIEEPQLDIQLEGCLSYPDQHYVVVRPTRIKVSYMDDTGRSFSHYLNGLEARVFLHETDHCNGIVFSQRGVLWVPPETG